MRGTAPADAAAPSPGAAAGLPGRRATAGGWPAPGAPGWFVAAVSLLLAVNVVSSRYLFPDSYYDLYAGRYILQQGLPHTNVFTSASPGVSWIDQQWLAQVLYYGAWGVGGYRLVAALSALLVTSGFALLCLLMLRRGVPPVRAFMWTLAAAVVSLGNDGIRAQSFAYLFIPLTLWLILADEPAPRLRRRTWIAVPMLVAWANTHGTVLAGAALVIGYAGYRAARALLRAQGQIGLSYLALAALAAGSVVCTPYGPGVLSYYTRFAGDTALGHHVLEWAPPIPTISFTWGFWAVVLATITAVVVAWRRATRPALVPLGMAVFLLALALTAIRNQVWFAFGGCLLAAETLARSSGGRAPAWSTGFRRVITGILVTLGAVSVGLLAATPTGQFESLVPRRAIGVAAAIARARPTAEVLGDDWSGSPMLWLYPALSGRVGFDARLEQYSVPQFTAYADFLEGRGPHWQRVTQGYPIIVVSRQHRLPLATALSNLPGWRVVYQDARGLVLARRGGR